MIGALLPALVPILGDALKRLFPDAEARQRAEAELNAALLARAGELEKAAADIIKTEAQSEHWLAACWRPILMLTFGLLIVARWLGWSAPGISEAEALKLWKGLLIFPDHVIPVQRGVRSSTETLEGVCYL